MTRAAHRILSRARADAWRRVGIPERWETPGTPPAPETPAPPAAPTDVTTGKNVAGPSGGDAGTGRPAIGNGNANHGEDER